MINLVALQRNLKFSRTSRASTILRLVYNFSAIVTLLLPIRWYLSSRNGLEDYPVLGRPVPRAFIVIRCGFSKLLWFIISASISPLDPESRPFSRSCFTLTASSLTHSCASVAKSCPTFCDLVGCSTPGLPVLHHLLELAQTHVRWVSDAIQPTHPLLSPSPLAFNLSQHQGLFHWVSASHQVVKGLEFQLQPQSFPWKLRVDFL